MPLARSIERELVEEDDDIQEILPLCHVAPNGRGFSIVVRDTTELTPMHIEYVTAHLEVSNFAPAGSSYVIIS